ncbi:hypothetical protein KW801_01700 [Candidatus Saccharibacteria bacterium]|nr:hypothetical protein [Candidatus Saccharibacteria bacterium]
MNELNTSSERIAAATYEWLKAEINNSAEDRNSYLDNFDLMRSKLCLGYEDDDNWSAKKDRDHIGRLPILYEGFVAGIGTPDADITAARMLLAPLMFLSGNYRVQSYIQAKDQQSYLSRRGKVIDIDLEGAIYSRLADILPNDGDFTKAWITVEGLNRRMEIAAHIGQTAMREVHGRLQDGLDFGQPHSFSVHKLKDSQYSWAGFAADVASLAAKLRDGELDAVPYPEPKSITDQQRVIPLGELLD